MLWKKDYKSRKLPFFLILTEICLFLKLSMIKKNKNFNLVLSVSFYNFSIRKVKQNISSFSSENFKIDIELNFWFKNILNHINPNLKFKYNPKLAAYGTDIYFNQVYIKSSYYISFLICFF